MQTGQVLWMYCTFLGGNLVDWRSKKQSAEVELRALVHNVCAVADPEMVEGGADFFFLSLPFFFLLFS